MFAFLKTRRWNSDPAQHEIANFLMKAATKELELNFVERNQAVTSIISTLHAHRWSPKEADKRILHAVSLAKSADDGERYKIAKRVLSR